MNNSTIQHGDNAIKARSLDILIVEDESIISLTLIRKAERMGHHVCG